MAAAGVLPGEQGWGDQALIEVGGLAMRYPTGRLALAGASLRLLPGELVVVLGHNGCGKSTMLKCIAGLQQPTAGSVSVGGRDITRLSGGALAQARMALALVFQQARLVLRRSVLANVLCGTLGRHRGLATAFGRLPKSEIPLAMRCLDLVGLADFAHQRAGTLSGGQAQRAAIARALAQRPSVLLADEPVASLDPEASEEVMRLLRHISAQDGLGIICVLHQPELARRYADRILGMRDGHIIFDVAPAQLAANDIASLYEGTAAQGNATAGSAAATVKAA